jgi:hypothetical protein
MLGDFSICLTLNDTVVVDPSHAQAIDVGNNPFGPVFNLKGHRANVDPVSTTVGVVQGVDPD